MSETRLQYTKSKGGCRVDDRTFHLVGDELVEVLGNSCNSHTDSVVATAFSSLSEIFASLSVNGVLPPTTEAVLLDIKHALGEADPQRIEPIPEFTHRITDLTLSRVRKEISK